MAPENRGSAGVEETALSQPVEPENRGGPRVKENRGGPRVKESALKLPTNNNPLQQIQLINDNPQKLSWQATITYHTPGDPQWLQLGETHGSINANATLPIAVTVSKPGMSGHQATVVFNWVPASSTSASVVVTVA